MKFSALKLMAFSSLLVLAAACQPMDGSSLLTDKVDDPSSHVLNKDPKSEELYLKSYSPTLNAPPSVTKAEVSGECYTSTYPSHSILVLESGIQLDIVDLNPSTDIESKKALCKNGKFNLAINTGALSSGVHNLRIILQAWDSKGQIVTNEVQGVSSVTLSK